MKPDEHGSEPNDYALCPVCQESINPDSSHSCGRYTEWKDGSYELCYDVDIGIMEAQLLRYLFKDVGENFEHLTPTEKKIIGSQEDFDRLLSAIGDIEKVGTEIKRRG